MGTVSRLKIVEHNMRVTKLLEQVWKLDIDEKQKDWFTLLMVLGMKTEDGELVLDKITKWTHGGGD